MKKRLFITSILVAVVTVMAGYNVYTSQNNVEVSDLILTNVEAFGIVIMNRILDGLVSPMLQIIIQSLDGTMKMDVMLPLL